MAQNLPKLSRREAATILVQAHRQQRPKIVPLDGNVSVKLPYKVWSQVIDALGPLAV